MTFLLALTITMTDMQVYPDRPAVLSQLRDEWPVDFNAVAQITCGIVDQPPATITTLAALVMAKKDLTPKGDYSCT